MEITMIKRKTIVEEDNILKEIKRNTTREKEVVQVLKKENRLTWEEDGVVYIEERIYILNNKKIKEKILKENHNLADVGHPEQYRILELIKRTYLSQTSFSLYLHNQWTDFHKLSCAGKPQMRAIRIYVGCTKATTND